MTDGRLRRTGPARETTILTVTALLLVSYAQLDAKDQSLVMELRLVPLVDGLRETLPEHNLNRLSESSIYKRAKAAGVDLEKPDNPFIAHRYGDGRLFYLFYKSTEEWFGDRPYVIQRIRKTERTWPTKGAQPETKVTYLVEVFATLAGALMKADRHYGSFGIYENHKHEVVKEYEIGFGEVPGHCEGTAWPYPAKSYFKALQPYQADVGLYDKVRFSRKRDWLLHVSFDKSGTYLIRSRELGIDVPKSLPAEADTRPKPNAASKDIVLEPGRGFAGFTLGDGTPKVLRRLLGKPLEHVTVGRQHQNISVATALTVNFNSLGVANTVITRPSFAGRTSKGTRLWDHRADVMKAHGVPRKQMADASVWKYDGIFFFFDGFDRVRRIVVCR